MTTESVELTEGKDVMLQKTARLGRRTIDFAESAHDQDVDTPSIEVTIGHQTRQYHAFVTTAPAACDARTTLALYAGPLTDVVGFALEPIILDDARARTPSQLVPIDTTEVAWQRARGHTRDHRLRRTIRSWLGRTRSSSGGGSSRCHRW